eukprot:CAMPEP_0183332472 /NCGR_PEP_ID=MMETSP0164_2-20130417/1623_1 /TAXON_ID=221442 /ORGANISM="Coccolithus pelagicus ssp braarudi, Strain PLY182g" /LENGTH=144 /DNA_ID=CAMNT_0025501195 /DNA_START=51 /DNA_END=485 /DNA_ORIENTATION=+
MASGSPRALSILNDVSATINYVVNEPNMLTCGLVPKLREWTEYDLSSEHVKTYLYVTSERLNGDGPCDGPTAVFVSAGDDRDESSQPTALFYTGESLAAVLLVLMSGLFMLALCVGCCCCCCLRILCKQKPRVVYIVQGTPVMH